MRASLLAYMPAPITHKKVESDRLYLQFLNERTLRALNVVECLKGPGRAEGTGRTGIRKGNSHRSALEFHPSGVKPAELDLRCDSRTALAFARIQRIGVIEEQ